MVINPLSTNFTKWSNTLKQFVGKLPTNCLSVFDHFVGLALKGLKITKVCYMITWSICNMHNAYCKTYIKLLLDYSMQPSSLQSFS